jgi:hypothetical protein
MTLRTKDRKVPPGAGNPRLVRATEGRAVAGSPEAEGREQSYPLRLAVTTIGSADGQEVQLDGVGAAHGEVRRDAGDDEFVYRHLDAEGVSYLDGAAVTEAGLHHGDRLTVGPWTLIFQRDEYADHGRFEGGREGGDASGPKAAGSGGQESEPRDSESTH